jgi:hypothetical protein
VPVPLWSSWHCRALYRCRRAITGVRLASSAAVASRSIWVPVDATARRPYPRVAMRLAITAVPRMTTFTAASGRPADSQPAGLTWTKTPNGCVSPSGARSRIRRRIALNSSLSSSSWRRRRPSSSDHERPSDENAPPRKARVNQPPHHDEVNEEASREGHTDRHAENRRRWVASARRLKGRLSRVGLPPKRLHTPTAAERRTNEREADAYFSDPALPEHLRQFTVSIAATTTLRRQKLQSASSPKTGASSSPDTRCARWRSWVKVVGAAGTTPKDEPELIPPLVSGTSRSRKPMPPPRATRPKPRRSPNVAHHSEPAARSPHTIHTRDEWMKLPESSVVRIDYVGATSKGSGSF